MVHESPLSVLCLVAIAKIKWATIVGHLLNLKGACVSLPPPPCQILPLPNPKRIGVYTEEFPWPFKFSSCCCCHGSLVFTLTSSLALLFPSIQLIGVYTKEFPQPCGLASYHCHHSSSVFTLTSSLIALLPLIERTFPHLAHRCLH